MLESPGYTSVWNSRPTDLHIQTGGAVKDKKGSTRAKLMKRTSRPTSPMLSPPPSADSLVLPVPTDDANKVLWLMKNLCGRMRGEVSYQIESNGPWYTGLCYIEDEKGSLMFDSSDNSTFHTAIISDLRGCRVLPVERPDLERPCLEVVNPQNGAEVLLWPAKADEADLWLAALLSWQQLRPSALRTGTNSQTTTPTSQSRPELIRRGSSTASTAPNVIKVSLVSLWDKGIAHSPRAIIKRASTRDLKSAQAGWRKVSCILYDNGELKLITENDGAVQCVIPLSQLSRCAIQQLHRSVLDEDFCIAIVPSYAATSTQLSLFRPVFISLEGRVLFEVWFVLMRAFTVPEIYAMEDLEEDPIVEVTDFEAEPTSDMFRVEKTINLRIIEAKFGGPTSPVNNSVRDRHGKHEQDAFVGNYFAEVHLDGDLRARTITKMATRTPFWRDDCEFVDLSANLPALQVVLKRYEGNMDSLAFPLHNSQRLPRGVNLTEIKCGSVDIPLHNLDRGRDYEEWRQIYDDRQQLIGTLLCKVRHEELIVFMARDYQTISEMLHRFSLGLTAQIAEALPGYLRRLAELFLNIFQVTNKSSEWLMALVEDEIDGIGQQAQMKKMRFSRRLKSSEALDVANANEREALRDMGKTLAGEANLLFRGNSLLTQALEFYMRRLGSDYVEEILGDKIYEINEINPNCEVDPGKLQSGEDINQHWDQLIHFTNEIWECIAQSASRFPAELRHILKYIRAVAEDRYGDFLRTVAFTSVSGFLFLRFICPAVLNPKLFGLLRDYPRPRAQRTLTLIAKALQALANLSSIGKKEVWMEPMNRRFLSARRQGLKDFIDEVCSIPAQSTSVILPAPYSTPVTILGRLSPLAREGFPSLPFLVDHARNFASLVKLWVDYNKGHTGDGLYDGELLAFHKECTLLQERADMCMNRIDSVR
ncbi:Rho GTPase activation protein, partial [Coniella lustricola]